MEAINLNEKSYAIDMDKLMEWVSETPPNENNITTSITQLWPIVEDEDDDSMQKEITETKSTMNDSMNGVRYDFVRNILNVLLSPIVSAEGIIVNEFTFGQSLAFNTLIQKGIIFEIKE